MKKKLFKLIVFGMMIIPFMISDVKAENTKITLYLFRGDGCPHCEEAMAYLDSIRANYQTMEIVTYEVFYHEENELLCNAVKEKLGSDSKGVPFIVIGERYLTGFAEYRKADIEAALEYYQKNPTAYKDVIEIVKTEMNQEKEGIEAPEPEVIKPVEMHEEKNKLYRNLGITTGLLVLCGVIYYWLSRTEKRA